MCSLCGHVRTDSTMLYRVYPHLSSLVWWCCGPVVKGKPGTCAVIEFWFHPLSHYPHRLTVTLGSLREYMGT